MRLSYAIVPDYPLDFSIEVIQLAEKLGFYGVYGADEIYHKDLYLLFAAAAVKGRPFSARTAHRPGCSARTAPWEQNQGRCSSGPKQ